MAVAYTAVFYVPVLFMLTAVDIRLVDWLIFMPPVSVLAWAARSALMALTADSHRGRRRARLVHLTAMAVFLSAVAFLALTVIAIIVTPIPLIGAGFHFHAARFYRD